MVFVRTRNCLIVITIVVLLLTLVQSPKNFCSVACRNTGCDGNLQSNCNGACMTSWISSPPTCAVNPATGYKYHDSTPDIMGGSMSRSNPATTTCGNMNLYGWFTPLDTITISTTGINKPYFQIMAYVSIIVADGNKYWRSGGGDSSIFSFQFFGNTPNTIRVSQRITNQKYCGSSPYQDYYLRFAIPYNYNITAVPLSWSISTNEPNTTAQWGLKQFIVLARVCDPACLSCFGIKASQCFTCNTTAPYWLSGTTCNQTCLSGYGQTDNTNLTYLCVRCNLTCVTCIYYFDYCTACTVSGPNIAWLDTSDPSYPRCVKVCPVGYYQNNTMNTCEQCNANCSTCFKNPRCTSCIDGWAWRAFVCYNPCEAGYFLTNITTPNCTKCSLYCSVCSGPADVCSVCTLNGSYIAFLLPTGNVTTCNRTCPIGFYGQTYLGAGPNTCLACDVSCLYCSGNPTPCSYCNVTYYLYQSACFQTCPVGFFPYQQTRTCLNCSQSCVGLTINMYFSNSLSHQIYIDMLFTKPLNWANFTMSTFQSISVDSAMYTMSMFTQTYTQLSTKSYRITLAPTGYIFLYNATFTVTTMPQPAILHTSADLVPFKSINYGMNASLMWFLIKGPPMTQFEINVITSFAAASNRANTFMTWQGMQQIKKSGIFGLIFSGAQITSCTILANSIASQNLYQGVRFWAIFVFFDAPNYQKNSDKTKYVVLPPVSQVISDARLLQGQGQMQSTKRNLFSTTKLPWRFQRTGQTSFFIYDVYMPCFLLLICWLSILIGSKFLAQKPWFVRYKSAMWSFTHKIHEISIMYVAMAFVLGFLYFQPTSFERVLDLAICAVVNLYFICYQLYIYYDMLKYPRAEIGNQTYEYFIVKYGSMLKNIRFVEYDINQRWSPKQWFRPYNYHFLSYYKKFIMIIAMPLFYDTMYAQISALLIIQALEILRFCIVWPFVSRRRNYLRLFLQIALLLFFACNLYQNSLVIKIMLNDPATIENTADVFYKIGWVGFLLCFVFNIGHCLFVVYDTYRGCSKSNRELMDEARRKYYYDQLNGYEQSNEDLPVVLVNKWVKLGNLNQRRYEILPDINVRIEYYRVVKGSGGKYEVEVKKLLELFMNVDFNYHRENNTSVGKKLNKRITITHKIGAQFYSVIDDLFKKYDNGSIEYITIKTFLKISQKHLKAGQQIIFSTAEMFQKIQFESYSGERTSNKLSKLLQGFPIDPVQINAI